MLAFALNTNVCLACFQYIQALEECHKKNFYKKAFGVCNYQKEALSKCFRETKLEKNKSTIKSNREKQREFELKWRELQEEEYGEDLILQKILHERINNTPSRKSNSE